MYANEEAVRLQFALPDKIYLFFLDKALMNKLNGGNKHLVTATPIFFLILSVGLYFEQQSVSGVHIPWL